MRIDEEAQSIVEAVGIKASLVRRQLNELAAAFPAGGDSPFEA
jgi:hypothetical protein